MWQTRFCDSRGDSHSYSNNLSGHGSEQHRIPQGLHWGCYPWRTMWINRTGFNVGMRWGVGRAPRREHCYIEIYSEKLRVLIVANNKNADQFIRWTDADFCSPWTFAAMAHRFSARECDRQNFAIPAVRAIRTAIISLHMVHSSIEYIKDFTEAAIHEEPCGLTGLASMWVWDEE